DASFSFEQSMNVNWDGAVIEVSHDSGATWQDISMYAATPAAFGTIGDPMGGAMNVLRNRVGFVGKNAAYPAANTFTFDLGTSLASQTILVRFRIGTDDAQGAFGITLDNLGFGGITNQPFASVV